MQVNVLAVTTTPQKVPVGANLVDGLEMRSSKGNTVTIYFSQSSGVSGAIGTPSGYPLEPGEKDFVPADHFVGGGDVYVVAEGGTQKLFCKSS